MKEAKNNINLKSFLTNIDKINTSFFKTNNTKNRKPSIQKDNIIYKLYPNDSSTTKHQKISKNEKIYEFNTFQPNNTNNNFTMNQKVIITKQNQHNFAHKRSFSKSIFNSINIMNNNNKYSLNNNKNNKSLGGNNNNSHEKNTPPLFINKNKGIILNKVNLFKNVKFKKPSLNNSNISKNSNANSNSSNTNTVIQSLSSLNMTSTDITTSTKRKKDNNLLNNNNQDISIHNINNINNDIFQHNNKIKNRNKQNKNKHFYNLTNVNLNKFNTTNSTLQYYKEILQSSNNFFNKIKKANNNTNTNNTMKNIDNKKLDKSGKKKALKDKRSISQKYFGDISKKKAVKKEKKNLTLNNIQNNNAAKTLTSSKNDGVGGTIISDDSVFNNSKRRSSSGTHNDSSKLSKGSGTISIDKKNKSISIDYTYSDDEIQTNRRKKLNKIQIDENNIDLNINKKDNDTLDKNDFPEKEIFNEYDNDINIDNLEFKNFCNDLSAKLFGNNI